MKNCLVKLGVLIGLLVPYPVFAQSPPSQVFEAYLPFYPASEIGLLQFAGYQLTNSQLVWLPKASKPELFITYHRAVPLYDRDITQHFSLVLKHVAGAKGVSASFRCPGKKQQKQTVKHPRFGHYFMCSEKLSSKAHPGAKNQTPIQHTLANFYPLQGNKLPHLTVKLHGFDAEILPMFQSLHTYSAH